MVKAKLKDIKKELDEEEKQNYGDETESGSSPDTEAIQNEDVDELVKDVTGQNPQKNIADEVNDAEEKLHEK